MWVRHGRLFSLQKREKERKTERKIKVLVVFFWTLGPLKMSRDQCLQNMNRSENRILLGKSGP